MAGKPTFSCHVHQNHESSVLNEVLCHMPYGIFSVALSFVIVSFLYFLSDGAQGMSKHAHVLFHSFHFLHIIFASTGAYIAFMRFTKRVGLALVMSFISAVFFCTLSDIILPYLSGLLLGVDVHLHLCIRSEALNVLIFWAIGLLNAVVLLKNNSATRSSFTAITHFSHIFTSAVASLLYLVAEGFSTWYAHMGILFVLLMGAVVVPCTLSDVIVPVLFGRLGKVDEEHSS